MLKYFKIYQKILEYIKNIKIYKKIFRINQNISEYNKIYQNMLEHIIDQNI